MNWRLILRSLLAAVLLAPTAFAFAEQGAEQILYLPIYSHIYYGNLDKSGKPGLRLLSAHVSIRNTDMKSSITVLYARYYDTNGKLVKDYLAAPQTIPPMGTAELFVPRDDASGGSGANFLIAWTSDVMPNPPLVEAVHAEFEMARTVIFTTEARPVKGR
jgi:hypothetical protein